MLCQVLCPDITNWCLPAESNGILLLFRQARRPLTPERHCLVGVPGVEPGMFTLRDRIYDRKKSPWDSPVVHTP